MESSNELSSVVNDFADGCQDPFQAFPCHARKYLICPHCSFPLCFEHGQQHQRQVQNEAISLHNRAKHLEQTLNEYKPVNMIVEQVFNSLNEWKQKMNDFVDQYSEQIKIHVQQAQNRLNDQWITTKQEYLQLLYHFVMEPIDQLLQGRKLYISFLLNKCYEIKKTTIVILFYNLSTESNSPG